MERTQALTLQMAQTVFTPSGLRGGGGVTHPGYRYLLQKRPWELWLSLAMKGGLPCGAVVLSLCILKHLGLPIIRFLIAFIKVTGKLLRIMPIWGLLW